MAELTQACPILAAVDPEIAASWYCDKLGFSPARVIPGEGYAIVSRDGAELHFWKCDDRRIAENTSAYIRVEGIDTVHSTMGQASDGGRISEVATREWGMREFYVWDPDGNLLRFGEPMPMPMKAT